MPLSYFQWIENSGIGQAIRASNWMFPVIEAFHLAGLALIGGAVLILDMRLFDMGLRQMPVARLARAVQPFLNGSLGLMLATGTLLFLSEAVKCYYSAAFWMKMIFLALAIIFTYTVQQRVALADQAPGPFLSKLVGAVSIILWAGVGVGGRWIAFQ
jgi:hypothetical protein